MAGDDELDPETARLALRLSAAARDLFEGVDTDVALAVLGGLIMERAIVEAATIDEVTETIRVVAEEAVEQARETWPEFVALAASTGLQ